MTTARKPAKRPVNTHFSSGPCAKRPGWSLKNLENAFLGRSHRAKDGKARLKLAIDKTKALLALPPDYLCAIVPASDTGAFEMAMWGMLGARGIDALGVGELRRRLGERHHQATEAHGRARAQRPSTAGCPISVKLISAAMCCSPGTAPPRVCACPTATGSHAIAPG